MELLPLGPVLFIDTAGVDDEGALGEPAHRAHPGRAGPHGPGRGGDRGRRLGRVRGQPARRARGAARAGRSWCSTRPTCGAAGHRGWRGSSSRACRRWSVSSLTGDGDRGRARGAVQLAPSDFFDSRRLVDRPGAARRGGGARGADRQGGAEGPADPAAGADDPRPARRRRRMALVVKERELRRRPGAADPPAGAGGHRLAGVPEGGRRHAAGRPDDLVLDPLVAVPKGDLAAQSCAATLAIERLQPRRPGARRRGVQPPPDRRGHRPGEDPALADPVRRRRAASSSTSQGRDFPADLSPYRLVVHCGACMGTAARCCRASSAAVGPACRSPTTG